MTWTSNPVVTVLVIGFVVLALAAGLARRTPGKKGNPPRDPAAWWTSSDADRRHQAGQDDTSRDNPGTGTGTGTAGDDAGGGGDGD